MTPSRPGPGKTTGPSRPTLRRHAARPELDELEEPVDDRLWRRGSRRVSGDPTIAIDLAVILGYGKLLDGWEEPRRSRARKGNS